MSYYFEQIHYPNPGPNWTKIGLTAAVLVIGGIVVYHVFIKKPAHSDFSAAWKKQINPVKDFENADSKKSEQEAI